MLPSLTRPALLTAAPLLILCQALTGQLAPAPYPGLELPADPPGTDLVLPPASPTSAAPSPGQAPRPPVSGLPALLHVGGQPETAGAALRDLDGDGHLDGLSLQGGLRVWLGRGDGSFDPPTVQPPAGDLPGRQADLDGDGRLDVVFAGTFSGGDVARAYLDQGDGSFLDLPAVGLPVDVETGWSLGDLDGDGQPDLVTALDLHNQPGEVHVLLATGLGRWDTDVLVGLLPDQIPAGTALGDLDLDGDLDVLAAWDPAFFPAAPAGLRSFVQGPAGSFSQAADLVTEAGLRDLRVVDLTADGLPDLLARSAAAGAWRHELWQGLGDGTLTSPSLLLPDLGADLRFVDLDGDGLVDLLSHAAPEPNWPLVQLARPDGSLSPVHTVRHVARPTGWGDLDGDGLLDLFSDQLPLLGRGDGRFESPAGAALIVGVQLQEQLTVADLDGDGQRDVVASQSSPTTGNLLRIVHGRGLGRFGEQFEIPEPVTVRTTAVADLDGDGFQDLLVCHGVAPEARIWLGRPNGSLVTGPGVFFAGATQLDVGAGHFNADGLPDLVALTHDGLRVRRNDGDLDFGPVQTLPLPLPITSSHGHAVEVIDVDGDGLDDVLVRQAELVLYRCLGHTQFAAPVQLTGFASHLTATDVDGDGDLDLLVSRAELGHQILSGGQSLEVLLGDGAGSFTPMPAWTLTSDRRIWGTQVADVDGDGLNDLLMGHKDAWSLHPGLPGGGFATSPSHRFDVPEGAHRIVADDLDDNGWPDVLTISAGGLGLNEQPGQGPTAFLHRAGPWSDAGGGLGGAAGLAELVGTGALLGGDPAGLELRDATPDAPSWLVLGLTALQAPLKGGTLVPEPLVLQPGPATDARGDLSLVTTWPAGLPAGVELWAQVWLEDAAGPLGLAASHGLLATTP